MGKDQPQSADQIASTVRTIALALDAAHRAGIVHRDLKPANIMIDSDREPIVMDFGLASHMQADEQKPLTLDGMVIGTPSYMAPEQIRSELGKIGPASDVYSLGVILYELLTGQRPFHGPMMTLMLDVTNEHKAAQPPSEIRPGCDPKLEAICLKMLSKSLADRYGSMREVAAELTDFVKVGRALLPVPLWAALPRRSKAGRARVPILPDNLFLPLASWLRVAMLRPWEWRLKTVPTPSALRRTLQPRTPDPRVSGRRKSAF